MHLPSSRSRLLAIGALLLAVLPGGCGSSSPEADAGPPRPVPTSSLQDEIFYFVLIDRFANGDPGNDQGSGPVSSGGFDPADERAFHGGDLAGLIDRLDYIQGLGVTALWVTPVVVNRAEQPGSRGYHGYWGVDFLDVDPHLGTGADFQRLVDSAHERGMKVFLDIVVNHTADIISYAECSACPYRNLAASPYTAEVAEAFQGLKNPAWLNDPVHYNNRGDSTFSGESSLYGDFFGLDDLDTRQRAVIDGMIDIYRHWIETYRIDGFRIDTAKHVDIELWQQFAPAIIEAAEAAGVAHFTMFGEVFDYDVSAVSRFTTVGMLPSALDFPLQGTMRWVFSQNGPTSALADLFRSDDAYTDADSSALMLMSFLGNHDIGRFGHFLAADGPSRSDQEKLIRAGLAHAFLMFARGVPVIYYGDEQGFTGDGDAEGARQDMMPSLVAGYQDDDNIGTGSTPADDNFDTGHPLYQAIASYAAVYRAHAPLRRGIQIVRHSSPGPGLFAFSRIIPAPADAAPDAAPENPPEPTTDPDVLVEYLVVFNTSPVPGVASIPTGTPNARFRAVHPVDAPALSSDARGRVRVSLEGLRFSIHRAELDQ